MLAALAAMRVGGGRLSLGVAESVSVPLAVAIPESGVTGLEETKTGAVRGSSVTQMAGELGSADVVLIGPGLTDGEETTRLVSCTLDHLADNARVVLDAAALTALADVGPLSQVTGRMVATPNLGEASAMLDRDVDETKSEEARRLAVEIADRYGTVVSMQGVVAEPDGRTWSLSTGHSGLATSGSGDVLAGAITGLVGRGADLEQAACWGTYLHAAAGDRLAARVGPTGFLARELLDEIPSCLVELLASAGN
jgi:ADP-dependent NAD(P)H-hydrate dehydratase